MRSIATFRLVSLRFFHEQQKRWIVTDTGQARTLLGILPSDVLEIATLRRAYFVAAKQCHPDTSSSLNEEEGHERFLRVTEAYELLVSQLQPSDCANNKNGSVIIPYSEEESFRRQCLETLGLSAEIVEECKINHGFRQWLAGNTDAAHLWRNFLMQHGGLAPRLQGNIPVLNAGTISTNQARRRRKR